MADIVRRERIQSVRRLSLSEEIKEATGAGPSEMNKAVDKEREARKLIMNKARKKIGLQSVTREHIEYRLPVEHNMNLNDYENEGGREAAVLYFLESEIKYKKKGQDNGNQMVRRE